MGPAVQAQQETLPEGEKVNRGYITDPGHCNTYCYCRFKYQDLYFSRQHQELKKINYVFNEDIFNHFKGEAI